MKTIFLLFFTFVKIGLLSIGGGYAIIPLIQEDVVHQYAWLTLQEFSDIITISQMTPGPLAINTASFVGIRTNGIVGAILATLGCILGGFVISILLYKFFQKYESNKYISNVLSGLLSSSIGLIAASASIILTMAFFKDSSLDLLNINIIAVLIFSCSLIILRKYKTNPILIIILTGIIGLLVY